MATDQPSAAATPPNSVPSPQKPRRKGRVLLILLLGLAGALVIGGGAAFVIYDQATAIDRSTPEVVVDQFLDAGLVQRDSRELSLFLCSSWSTDAAMRALAAPTDPKVIVSWGDVTATKQGGNATVSVSMQFSVAVNGGYHQSVEQWRLSLADQNGWRVCSLSKG